MTDEEYEAWLGSQELNLVDTSLPNEENLITMFSYAMRTTTAEERAKSLVDVANMCLAMADKTLGSQNLVAKCLVLNKH